MIQQEMLIFTFNIYDVLRGCERFEHYFQAIIAKNMLAILIKKLQDDYIVVKWDIFFLIFA